MTDKPKAKNSESAKELDRVEQQFNEFEQQVKDLTQDRMNEAPKLEMESQTKMSQREISKSQDIYLKPFRTISSREKFNEEYRDAYNFDREYVRFIAENHEVIGENIELWIKKYPGTPAEEWKVPVNKPVWAPRMVAERIAGCFYHRLSMKDSSVIGSDGMGTYHGQMVIDNTVQRLNALPATTKKSVFL